MCNKKAWPQNMVQIITNNALVCKVVGLLLEVEFPHLFLDPLCGSYFEP